VESGIIFTGMKGQLPGSDFDRDYRFPARLEYRASYILIRV
jgi:hypothetical protein